MSLIVKDAAWQIVGRIASAVGWFLVIKLITPYLWPLRFGDYSTILKYFAIWSAFADFGLYVIAMKQLWALKKTIIQSPLSDHNTPIIPNSSGDLTSLHTYYHKFVSSRMFMIGCVYGVALFISYLIPSYTSNPYLVWWLPLGMIFSASFMTAGILQIPLQLYRRMNHVSIWLILARGMQLAIIWATIWWIYPIVVDGWDSWVWAFVAILFSVVASWITQWVYVYYSGKNYIPLKWNWDRVFTKRLLTSNWQYGLAYYLSSFHTLIVLILLSIFYPTTQGFIFVWVYGLALSLIEILLIIPSALGNSLMHDIWTISLKQKRQRFWSLMMLVVVIWLLVIGNFFLFGSDIIHFLWWSEYLSTPLQYWSDVLLPFFWCVITLSFIKQVFNYLFVSVDLHNKLLWINLFGVVVWVSLWVPLILQYNVWWWVATQILLEILFVVWAIYVAYKHRVIPTFFHLPISKIILSVVWGMGLCMVYFILFQFMELWYWWIVWALILNTLIAVVLFPVSKKILSSL